MRAAIIEMNRRGLAFVEIYKHYKTMLSDIDLAFGKIATFKFSTESNSRPAHITYLGRSFYCELTSLIRDDKVYGSVVVYERPSELHRAEEQPSVISRLYIDEDGAIYKTLGDPPSFALGNVWSYLPHMLRVIIPT